MPADKTAILLIAYGSCLESGLAALRTFEARTRARYPDVPVRWAYTSENVRIRLASQARAKSDSVVKAVRRLALERFAPIVAQPLQIVTATENEGVEDMAKSISEEIGVPVAVGAPLLATDEDVRLTARAMISHLPEDRAPGEDVVFVGHGASHWAQARYAQLASAVADLDAAVRMATLSGDMAFEALLPRLSSRRVWLVPLLAGVGKHTVSDIGGAHAGSLRSLVEGRGHECAVVEAGVLGNPAFADIWLAHLDAAMASFGRRPAGEPARRPAP